MSKKVVIVDYQIGNIFSVQHACAKTGLNSKISSSVKEIFDSHALILPGVGAFNEAMQNIHKLNMFEAFQKYANSGRPVFGICLGLQLLFTKSSEFKNCNGLNLIQGEVKKMKKHPNAKIPHMGWNKINQAEQSNWDNTPLKNATINSCFYFVHSFAADPKKNEYVLCTTDHGDSKYCAAVLKENIFATQFHPEKSGKIGLKIYEDWSKINKLT